MYKYWSFIYYFFVLIAQLAIIVLVMVGLGPYAGAAFLAIALVLFLVYYCIAG